MSLAFLFIRQFLLPNPFLFQNGLTIALVLLDSLMFLLQSYLAIVFLAITRGTFPRLCCSAVPLPRGDSFFGNNG
jgi:hypothetical protein